MRSGQRLQPQLYDKAQAGMRQRFALFRIRRDNDGN